MPYYVYRIDRGASALVKRLTLLQQFPGFREAKAFARAQRAEQAADDAATIKVMFADNELQAEEGLQERRDAPVLREWEK